MISTDDLKRIAREKEVDPTTIERDHVQNWMLKSLYDDTDILIFKGGTSIRKAFIQDYRFSDDLDFTLSRDVKQDDLRDIIKKANEQVHDEIGVIFEEDIPFKDVDTGWKIKLRYTSRVTGAPVNLILDLTRSEMEVVVTDIEEHRLIQDYDEECKVILQTYSLIEITTEKARALCQRGWPRDLYDVYTLGPKLEKEGLSDVFKKKCSFKGFEPTLNGFDSHKESLKSAWVKSLGHQVKEVPAFEDAFQAVRRVFMDELDLE